MPSSWKTSSVVSRTHRRIKRRIGVFCPWPHAGGSTAGWPVIFSPSSSRLGDRALLTEIRPCDPPFVLRTAHVSCMAIYSRRGAALITQSPFSPRGYSAAHAHPQRNRRPHVPPGTSRGVLGLAARGRLREIHDSSERRSGAPTATSSAPLGEEVLASCSEEARKFLLETSVLRTMTGPPCDAVTGKEGSANIPRGLAPISSWFLWRRGRVVPLPLPILLALARIQGT